MLNRGRPTAASLSLSTPQNWLLSSLPPVEYQSLAGNLRPINLPHRMVLYEPNRAAERVYFPESGMVSLIIEDLASGKAAAVGAIGREGLLGMQTAPGSPPALTRAVMQIPGQGWWLPRAAFEAECR